MSAECSSDKTGDDLVSSEEYDLEEDTVRKPKSHRKKALQNFRRKIRVIVPLVLFDMRSEPRGVESITEDDGCR